MSNHREKLRDTIDQLYIAAIKNGNTSQEAFNVAKKGGAMIGRFIPFENGYEYLGHDRFAVAPRKGPPFIAEVREVSAD